MEEKYYGVFYDDRYKDAKWKAKVKFLTNDTRPSFIPQSQNYYLVGRYKTAEEAAKAFDAFVIEHGLNNSTNFDKNGVRNNHKRRRLTSDEVQFIQEFSHHMSDRVLAEHLSVTVETIKRYKNNIKKLSEAKKYIKDTPIIVITSKELFEKVLNA